MEKIEGIEVHNHKDSSRILNIQLDDEIVKQLIFPITFPLSFKVTVTPVPANPMAQFSGPAFFSIVPLLVKVAVSSAAIKTVACCSAVAEELLLYI